MRLRRRDLLRAAGATAALAALPRRSHAIGAATLFRFGQLQLGASSNPRPSALRRLAWEIDKRTAIAIDLEPKTVSLGDDGLHETPFLYLAGDREFAIPSEDDLERLRRFLTFGGFLLIDSAEGASEGAFDGSVRQLVEALYPPPADGLAIVAKEHVVYKSFYLLEHPVGRVAVSATMEAVERDGHLALAYVKNDLGGAWARDNYGNYEYQCEPGGEAQREQAFRLGINLVMYALCLDYKTDQVHVEYIMRRRRWKPEDGADTPAEASPAPSRGGSRPDGKP